MTAHPVPVPGTAELSVEVPEGLSQRPLVTADAAAVTAVMAAQELQDVGEVFTEEADILADWQKPSYDVRASSIGVFGSERLVAYAEFFGGDRGTLRCILPTADGASVQPSHDGCRGKLGWPEVPSSGCRLRWARRAMCCSSSWDTACGERRGSWRCPRDGASNHNRCPMGTPSGPP